MPKSAKKRQAKKDDFQKKKLKVGKKNVPDNHTNTAFNTKTIIVPDQHLAADTSSLQILKDHVSHLSNYSAIARKDALVKIRDLISAEPPLLSRNLGLILNASLPLVTDRVSDMEDDVRRGFLMLISLIAKSQSLENLYPFIPKVATYGVSGMNHIVDDVRLDAVRFVAIWMNKLPDQFVGFASQILPSFISILASERRKISSKSRENTTSKSSNHSSEKTRILVLESLRLFLHNLTKVQHNGSQFQTFAAPKPTETVFYSQGAPLQIYGGRWEDQSRWALDEIFLPGQSTKPSNESGRINMKTETTTKLNKEDSRHSLDTNAIFTELFAMLVDLWLDSASTVFGGSAISDTPILERLSEVLKTMQSLTSFCLQTGMREAEITLAMQSISKHILPYYPFGNNAAGIRNDTTHTALSEMNFILCRLVSDLESGGSANLAAAEGGDKLFVYLIDMITGKQKKKGSNQGLISGESLVHLFPVCQRTLNSGGANRLALMKALTRKNKELSEKSNEWKSLFEFIRFLLIDDEGTSRTIGFEDVEYAKTVRAWVAYLPKALWALSDSNPTLSEATEIQNTLIPFFYFVVPSKGPLFGPFIKLPEQCQLAALHLLYYLPAWPEKLIIALVACLNVPTTVSTVTEAFLETLVERQSISTTALEWDSFFGVSLTVGVVGHSAAELDAMRVDRVGVTVAKLEPLERLISLEGGGTPMQVLKRRRLGEYAWALFKRVSVSEKVVSHVVTDFITHLLDQCLPLDTVIGILVMAKYLALAQESKTELTTIFTESLEEHLVAVVIGAFGFTLKECPDQFENGDDIEDIKTEISILAELNSDYVTKYHGSYIDGSSLWIVMEYCEGGSCLDLIGSSPLNEALVAIIMRGVLSGLEYIHSMGKIHRDIKAANILLTEKGEVKLADFGVSAQSAIRSTKPRPKINIGRSVAFEDDFTPDISPSKKNQAIKMEALYDLLGTLNDDSDRESMSSLVEKLDNLHDQNAHLLESITLALVKSLSASSEENHAPTKPATIDSLLTRYKSKMIP
ncbi:putative protein serine/threonine kinase [Chytridiales sp. JEL 0842]|nr:putative protein serine/threonine kinase [Chytridiales sp. JEL 0842]